MDKDELQRKDLTNDEPAASLLHVVIVTTDHAVFDGMADKVIAPSVNGQVTILPHHIALLARLESGKMVIGRQDETQDYAIGGGFLEVCDNQVTILADTAERGEEIDIARAETARQRASLLVKRYQGQPEYAAVYQALRRSRTRIKVGRMAAARRTLHK